MIQPLGPTGGLATLEASDIATRIRSPEARQAYLAAAWPLVPRLLTAIDRNPFRPTYGCLDRQFWHYRTIDFASEMYQEGSVALALAATCDLPGNRWFGNDRVRELAQAAVEFTPKASHRDGSCDDYYPFERALGAAVFSLVANTHAYELLGLDNPAVLAWITRRSEWVMRNDESGRLANHHALAAVGLLRASRLTGRADFERAAIEKLHTVLEWQSDEGWFAEYEGADPGYQTVTIDCLVTARQLGGYTWLDEPLTRATRFARSFLHPDGSYAGEYGSRGTYHFYPHGFERLAATNADAADLADGFLTALATGKTACFDDDRLIAHRLGNLIEAYRDWSPTRPPSQPEPKTRVYPEAKLVVRTSDAAKTIVSGARGGIVKHFRIDPEPRLAINDAGVILETSDGRVASSQLHDLSRGFAYDEAGSLVIEGPLHWARFETATPLKQWIFRTLLLTVGRFCRTAIRKLLQRRLITGRRECPIRHRRTIDFVADGGLRIVDELEITDPRLTVTRLGIGSDHQTTYVAAANVHQDAVLTPWLDWSEHLTTLNTERKLRVERHDHGL
jgi:hypothetical protein